MDGWVDETMTVSTLAYISDKVTNLLLTDFQSN